ncbi:MAG: ABC transporter permease [Gammaproteobacteria bacterium]|nr:ABC transporter permease [Gammaproteobacteria bacterium]
MSVETIPLARLALAFVPVAVVVAILWRWRLGAGNALYAIGRMLAQLVLIGYLLTFIFAAESPPIVLAVLAVMLGASGWIALQPLAERSAVLYLRALGSIAAGGVVTLLLVTQGVLDAEPWFAPRVVIPLAGMIFANSMTAVSLAGERLFAEIANGKRVETARRIAFQAALIPQVNALLAVGLVSLPGMMTGQILSGVSPLVAVRYQIMVMAMIFGSAGIAAACFLAWQARIERSEAA